MNERHGGVAVDDDAPRDAPKTKVGKGKEPVIASSGRVAKAAKGKAKRGGKKTTCAKRK